MCGRFTLRTPAKDIAELFRLADVPDLRPSYNIAPTQPVAAVRLSTTGKPGTGDASLGPDSLLG